MKRRLGEILKRNRRRERGATVVIVTISMISLLGMAAVSVDYAIASEYKSQVQNGADAAALAMAKHCAVKSSKCNPTTGVAETTWYVNQNAPGATATVSPAPAYANKTITVTAKGDYNTTFARVLGSDKVEVKAKATATWNSAPIKGTPNIPMGIGFCDWQSRQGTVDSPGVEKWYRFDELINSGTSCTGVPRFPGKTVKHPSDRMMWFTSSIIPGWNVGSCRFSPNLWDVYKDAIGSEVTFLNTACDPVFRQLSKGDVILMPIYGISNWRMPWIGIEFPNSVAIVGFAPFKITGFRKNGILGQTNSNDCRFPAVGILFGLGNCSQIRGQFVRTARPYPGWEYGETFQGQPAEDLGAVKVRLVQ